MFGQTATDVQAAQRQAEIIQKQEQERIQREREAAQRREDEVRGSDTKALQPVVQLPVLGAGCHDIQTINITGAYMLNAWYRETFINEFARHCLMPRDIERLMTKLTRYYVDAGYITTRVYLPAQDLSTGEMEIRVVEGMVEKVVVDDNKTDSVSIANIFPGIEGDILNLRNLEQGIDQLNRIASNSAQIDVKPGSTPGNSIVVVHNQPTSPYHVNISTDNQGAESTGVQQTGLTLIMDNRLHFNEVVSVSHRESTPNTPGKSYAGSDSASVSVPFGRMTMTLSTSRSAYTSTIHVPSGLNLVAEGIMRNSSARLDRVVFRNKDTRASVAATVTTKDSMNYLDGQFLSVSSRKLTVVDLDSNVATSLGGGVLSLDLGMAQGIKELGALSDLDSLPEWASHAQFKKVKAGFTYLYPFHLFNLNASFTTQATAQQTNTTLYGSEQISIGGIYSVRGFVKNTLAGDSGYFWRNEIAIRRPIMIGKESIPTRFYLGYDQGEVKNVGPNIPQGLLSGLVIGMTSDWHGATFDLFNTQPLVLPGNMTRESNQTWFRLSYTF